MSASAWSGSVTSAPLKRKADDIQEDQKSRKKAPKADLDGKIEDALKRIEALRRLLAVVGDKDTNFVADAIATLDIWSGEIADIKAGKDEIRIEAFRLKFPDVTGQSSVMGTSGPCTSREPGGLIHGYQSSLWRKRAKP